MKFQNTSINLPLVSEGAYVGVLLDVVRSPDFFLRPSQLDGYKYTFLDYTTLNDESVYIIQFEPNSIRKGIVSGKLYIEKKTHAIVMAEYGYTKQGVLEFNRLQEANLSLLGRRFKVSYFWYEGYWRLQSARVEQNFQELNTSQTLFFKMDYVTTVVIPAEEANKENRKSLEMNDVFAGEVGEISPDYWGDYLILEGKRE